MKKKKKKSIFYLNYIMHSSEFETRHSLMEYFFPIADVEKCIALSALEFSLF